MRKVVHVLYFLRRLADLKFSLNSIPVPLAVCKLFTGHKRKRDRSTKKVLKMLEALS